MLSEIFFLRLEAVARTKDPTIKTNDTRFVPLTTVTTPEWRNAAQRIASVALQPSIATDPHADSPDE